MGLLLFALSGIQKVGDEKNKNYSYELKANSTFAAYCLLRLIFVLSVRTTSW